MCGVDGADSVHLCGVRFSGFPKQEPLRCNTAAESTLSRPGGAGGAGIYRLAMLRNI